MTLRDRYNAFITRHEVAWELTFAGLAIIFVALAFVPEDAPAEVRATVDTLDLFLTGVFAAEFFSRIAASRDRRAYFRGHWIDLLALIPPVRGLRVLRLVRLLRVVRAFSGIARALSSIERLAVHKGLLWLFAAWLAVMVLCSMGLYVAEVGPNQAVTTPLDAIWWGIVTLSTVGYGDVYPVTPEGRLAASILMILGIALYSAIIATVTSFMMSDRGADQGVIADELERLERLHQRGSLTVDEYSAAKARIIGTAA